MVAQHSYVSEPITWLEKKGKKDERQGEKQFEGFAGGGDQSSEPPYLGP